MLSLAVVGGAAGRVCRAAGVVNDATGLGCVETLMERRSDWPGEAAMGPQPSLIRLSVGIEHVEDLWVDLEQA